MRIGVLLDTTRPPRWIRQILEDIRQCSALDLVLILAEGECDGRDTRNRLRGCTLLRIWTGLDYLLRRGGYDSFARREIDPREFTDEVLNTGSLTSGSSTPIDIQRVKDAELDVIVNLGSRAPSPELVHAAKRGVWEFDRSEQADFSFAENAPHFLARHHGGPIVAEDIRCYTRQGSGLVMHRAYFPSSVESVYRSQNIRYARRSGLLIQRLCALRENDWKYTGLFNTAVETDTPEAPGAAPGNLEVARLLASTALQGARRIIDRRLKTPHWFIAVRPGHGFPSNADMSGFKVLHAPHGRYYADPFVIEEGGKTFVFFEDFCHADGKAVISYVRSDANGKLSESRVALEAPYHLSYPFLFRWRGEIFMMPETSTAGRIEVFRAVEFPDRWQRHTVLIDNIRCYDPTMVEHEGKFWLFVSGALSHGAENSDLSIFYADQPFGKWRAHPGNPVISDARRARPAGSIFCSGGHLYRPAQDCCTVYGRAVTLGRIELLTETAYWEVPVSRIEPDWFPGNVGTHTFNQTGRIQVIDGRVLAPLWKRS